MVCVPHKPYPHLVKHDSRDLHLPVIIIGMPAQRTLIPIYTTRGDIGAYLSYPFILNQSSEWIGWVTPERDVYSVSGSYIGYLSSDPRILRRVSEGFDRPKRKPPSVPGHVQIPALKRLAPMMPDLPFGIIDVLDDDPELMPPMGFGALDEELD